MEFKYYIYIDYSEKLIGYVIIEEDKVEKILPKIAKFHHYKKIKHKRQYLAAIKKIIAREEIKSLLFKYKIHSIRYNVDIFSDVLEFIKIHDNCLVFVSVDNNQYRAFLKLFDLTEHKENVSIKKESELKRGSKEYKLSLIIDNLLNIKRIKEKSK